MPLFRQRLRADDWIVKIDESDLCEIIKFLLDRLEPTRYMWIDQRSTNIGYWPLTSDTNHIPQKWSTLKSLNRLGSKKILHHEVDALLVGDIGMRPLMSAHQAGIKVFHETKRMEILPVVEDLIAGKIPEINDNQVCGGGSHHHIDAGL